jgi:hypothetical protein
VFQSAVIISGISIPGNDFLSLPCPNMMLLIPSHSRHSHANVSLGKHVLAQLMQLLSECRDAQPIPEGETYGTTETHPFGQ